MNGPKVDAAYLKALDRLRAAIVHGLEQAQLDAPTVIRLAIHDAVTYESKTNTSGANGSIRSAQYFFGGDSTDPQTLL